MTNLCVDVKFPNRLDKGVYSKKKYSYRTTFDDLKEGDLVVVPTSFGYSVATVVGYTKPSIYTVSLVAAKFDERAYHDMVEKEKLIDQQLKKIEMKLKEVQEEETLREISMRHPELHKLVQDLEEIKSL